MAISFPAFCRRQAQLRRLTDFIGARLDDYDLRLEDLAEVACLSPAQLLRVYQSRVGEAPMQTLRRLRLQRAYAELAQPLAPPITQIAFSAGYDSNAAFSHAFRRQFGCAPRAIHKINALPVAPMPRPRLISLPELKVWQFRYAGAYRDNGYYKARLAWLCLNADGGRWRGWRLNDRDHPFCEDEDQHVDLCHFVPRVLQPNGIPEADLLTRPGGLYAAAQINPADREHYLAQLPDVLRADYRCMITEHPLIERDLHIRDFRAPQDRRIALYVPVARLG